MSVVMGLYVIVMQMEILMGMTDMTIASVTVMKGVMVEEPEDAGIVVE